MGQQFGDTTLTKVFVGGLAWETQKEALRDHFGAYGEILEAVIISDKLTGRSKGYGFVTFKEAEAARKACEDPTPVINGRRANCNLASLGARRAKASPPATPALPSKGQRCVSPAPPAPWYHYPSGTPPPAQSPYYHPYAGVFPYAAAAAATAAYGHSPAYVMDSGYSTQKLGYVAGGSYEQGQFQYAGHGRMFAPNAMLPMYPVYHFPQHQAQSMGVPAHMFPPIAATVTGTMTTIPNISNPPSAVAPPKQGCVAVEPVKGCS